MKNNKYLIAGVIFCILIALILLREFKGNYYRVSAEEAYKISLKGNIFITPTSLDTLKDVSLVIVLSEKSDVIDSLSGNHFKSLKIRPSELLKWKNRRQFKNLSGSIILQAENPGLATNAWVILSRRGYRNIKILDVDSNEELKYTFQPDTLTD